MVSHDCVAFYLLSEQVSQHVKVVQCGPGRRRGVRRLPLVPAAAEAAAAIGRRAYADGVLRPPARRSSRGCSAPAAGSTRTPARTFVARALRAPGRRHAPSTAALRLDTEVMLVDDPVKRVDNMTMAWGLEARVPFLDHELVELAAACPPELKLAARRQGRAQGRPRGGVLPAEVIDRPKGYFPVPRSATSRARRRARARGAPRPGGARRALFDPAWVARLLAEPNDHLTTLQGNTLWQLGLLELWLQRQGV